MDASALEECIQNQHGVWPCLVVYKACTQHCCKPVKHLKTPKGRYSMKCVDRIKILAHDSLPVTGEKLYKISFKGENLTFLFVMDDTKIDSFRI